MKAPWDWSRPARRVVVGATLLVVAAGVMSTWLRTRAGGGGIGADDALVLGLLASPSLLLVPLTREWRTWFVQCLLAVVAWAPFLGPGSDLSCTDCGFALLIPLNVAAAQLVLCGAAILLPRLGGNPSSGDGPTPRP